YRRGKLTNHKVFDEATAILAGDALLTYSFEIVANDPLLEDKQKVEIITRLAESSGPKGMVPATIPLGPRLAESSGPKGMVAGQILDLEAEKKEVSLEELERIHTYKTGELIKFAIY